jgi:alpha-tubulin suppressor-like RCC1 family protein
LTTWKSVSVGQYHTTAIKTDGTLWAWGFNQFSRLGDGTEVNKSSPVQIGSYTTWVSSSAGSNHNHAIKT